VAASRWPDQTKTGKTIARGASEALKRRLAQLAHDDHVLVTRKWRPPAPLAPQHITHLLEARVAHRLIPAFVRSAMAASGTTGLITIKSPCGRKGRADLPWATAAWPRARALLTLFLWNPESTHMPLPAVAHYLKETARVLDPGPRRPREGNRMTTLGARPAAHAYHALGTRFPSPIS
jgi:hypothetical protein